MIFLKPIFLVAFFLLNHSIYAANPQPLKVVRVTPQGVNVPEAGQIIIEFNKPMAKLGKSAPQGWPIILSPEVKGKWVWLNDKTLSLNIDLENGLKKATKYTIVIKPGLKSLNQSMLEQESIHEFVTSLPQPRWFEIKTWETPNRPVIRGSFDQAVQKDSLEKHLFFVEKEDKSKKTAVRLTCNESDDKGQPAPELKVARYWIVEAVKDLDSNKHYQLSLEAGLLTEEGTEPGVAVDSLLEFKTFDDFKFVGFRCKLNKATQDDKPVVFTAAAPQKEGQACDPLKPIELLFTAPVMRSQLKHNMVLSPDPTRGNKEINIWGDDEDYSQLSNASNTSELYPVRLPYGLKAATEYDISVKLVEASWWKKLWKKIIHLTKKPPKTDLHDEFGRTLTDAFSLTIKLDDRKPNFVIAHHNAILEKQVNSDVPLYVNNLKSATLTYQVLTSKNLLKSQVMTYEVPYVRNVQFAIPFNLRKLLGGESGIVYGALETSPMVDKGGYEDEERTLFAQVTPYQVQVKVGHFNTLIWVTDLATGAVVSDAKVTVYPGVLHELKRPETILGSGVTDANGVAILEGQEKIDPKRKFAYGWGKNTEKLFVLVEKADEMALLPLTSSFEIDTYRASGEKFWSSVNQKYEYLTSWGTTAQGVYRAGDKVQYKFYIRNQDNNHFVPPPLGRYDLEITDPTNKVIHEIKDIALNKFGAFDGEFTVSKNGAMGWYRFEVKVYLPDMKEEKVDPKTGIKLPLEEPTVRFSPMSVLISDFTPSPFKVSIEADGVLFQPNQEITLTTLAKLHSGGAYTDAKAQIAVVLQAESFHSTHPQAENFFFGAASDHTNNLILLKKEGSLDSKGEYEVKYTIPNQPIFYGKLLIEGKVTDDRGKSVAANKMLDYISASRLVGLHQKQWVYSVKKPAEIEVIVVDEKGVPTIGSVEIKVEKKETSVAKVKTAGNVYKTNANHEWKEVTKQSVSSKGEAVVYSFVPETAGVYKITAITKDDKQRPHHSEMEVYVAGSDFVLWGEENDTYLPVIPEKSSYQVGETARFLIKNPYPNAKALITVERFGVIDRFVQTLESNSPIIEIPVKPDYLPNFYVSVTVFSPRVGQEELVVGQLDLAKPAFRMGYAKISVKDHYKELVVTAKSEKEVYKPRDKVKVDLTAALKHPTSRSGPIELAIVVMDEAVLDLVMKGKQYYDPYLGFYKDESLGVRNFSLLNGLVGRMKFEKKGANPGGDGGADLSLRNIFKFVSYWNPSVIVNENGKANIEFDAPDNLSGWRIFAIAMTPTDQMGLGEGSFKVNKSTELRPIMPNQIAEGDQFQAGFNVMNRTDKKREIKVSISAQGPIEAPQGAAMHQEVITLEPFKRTTVFMPIRVKKGQDQVTIEFKARAGDEVDEDQLSHSLVINRDKSLETVATSGTFTDEETVVPLSIPAKIFPNRGGIQVSVSPSILNNIAGVFSYMKDYPYSCWEQKISRAVIAGHYKSLKAYMGDQLDWPNSDDFVTQIIEDAASFQSANGGMAYYRPKDDYVDPFLSAFTALSFGWLTDQGYSLPPLVRERLQNYLEPLLKQDFPETYYDQSMVATTRAVILEALAYHGKATLSDVERFLPHVKKMNAYGKSSFARAAMKVEGAGAIADQVVKELLSHFNETPTQMTWAEDLSPTSLRILDTPLRETCSALETLAQYSLTPKGKQLVGDKAIKLAKTVTRARKSKLHWENTQENLYCARALATYSKVFEKEPPQMTVIVDKATQEIGRTTFNQILAPAVEFQSLLGKQEIGKEIDVSIKKQGTGRLYYTTRLQYALDGSEAKPVNAGLEVRREYSQRQGDKWVLLNEASVLKRGDLVRVDLYVSAPAYRIFVVVNDPMPGCLESVNKDLATASILDQRKLDDRPAEGAWWYKFKDWIDFDASRWAFYHKEMRHESVRFYADYLPKGNYYLSYVAQVIANGNFSCDPTHIEEMYTPETYGRGAPARINVSSP